MLIYKILRTIFLLPMWSFLTASYELFDSMPRHDFGVVFFGDQPASEVFRDDEFVGGLVPEFVNSDRTVNWLRSKKKPRIPVVGKLLAIGK